LRARLSRGDKQFEEAFFACLVGLGKIPFHSREEANESFGVVVASLAQKCVNFLEQRLQRRGVGLERQSLRCGERFRGGRYLVEVAVFEQCQKMLLQGA
jgi:hypothetical protein